MGCIRTGRDARSVVVYAVSLAIAALPMLLDLEVAFADEVVQEAEKGQRTGANFLLNYELPTVIDAPPPVNTGDNEIYSQELFPGYDPADPSRFDDLLDLGATPEDLTTEGFGKTLELGAGSDESSLAYQALDDAAANPHEYDLSGDNFLDASREIIGGTSTILDEILTGCTDQVTAGDPGDTDTTHLEDIWTCHQAPSGAAEECRVTRDFVLVPVETKEVLRVAVADPPGCSTGFDVSHWSPAGWSGTDPQGNGAGACYSTDTASPPYDWWGTLTVTDPPLGNVAVGTRFCGDFSVQQPTEESCETTALWQEHLCRGDGVVPNPAMGDYGTCSAPEGPHDPFVDPVDYSGCDGARAAFCRAVVRDYVTECRNQCDPTGGEHWDLFGGSPGGGICRERKQHPPDDVTFFEFPSDSRRLTMVRAHYLEYPNEPGQDQEIYWAGYYCGTHEGRSPSQIRAACTSSANGLEGICRNTVADPGGLKPPGTLTQMTVHQGGTGNCNPTQELAPFSYSGCPTRREQSCRDMRDEHYFACIGPPANNPPMNGTESITTPAIGDPELLEDQSLFGTSVDLIRDPMNPSDHGLLAGQYVIASQLVIGDQVVDSVIDHGGRYGTNWDFDLTATVANAEEFTVEATMYRIEANGFIYTGCSQADVVNVDTGMCAGTITCTDYTPPCRNVDGVEVCEPVSPTDGITEILSPWNDFVNGIPEMCWEADVEILDCVVAHDCFLSGDCVSDCSDLPPELQPACEAPPCWIDGHGNEICLDSTAENWVDNLGEPGFVDDCADLLDRTECVIQPEVACVEGMEDDVDPGNLGLCGMRIRFFDCGYDVDVPGVPGADQVDTTCEAAVRCFGDECANTVQESNPDFVRAATAGTLLNEFQKDVSCVTEGDPSSCTIFEGTSETCRDPVGSYLGIIPDCCEESRTAGMAAGGFIQYMQLAAATWRLATDPIVAQYLANTTAGSALEGVFGGTGAIQRAKQAVGNAVVNGFNSALQWAGFSPIETASQATDVVADIGLSPTGFGPVQQFIAQGAYDFLNNIGLDALGDSLFSTTSEGLVTDWATSGLGKMVGAALSVIGLIYTVYNVLKILGSIIFACEEEELAFGIQQVNRACHYVGEYCSTKVRIGPLKKCIIETKTFCCFSSPLPRIMNQQFRLQGIGPEWGTAKAPNCQGVTLTELETVDWALVDLSEWEAIMFEAGIVPDPNNPPTNFYPTDRHPGDSSGGSNDGVDSVTINTDTIGIIQQDAHDARYLLPNESLSQPDPELMPWYEDGGSR